jgi:hypothetical protein
MQKAVLERMRLRLTAKFLCEKPRISLIVFEKKLRRQLAKIIFGICQDTKIGANYEKI